MQSAHNVHIHTHTYSSLHYACCTHKYYIHVVRITKDTSTGLTSTGVCAYIHPSVRLSICPSLCLSVNCCWWYSICWPAAPHCTPTCGYVDTPRHTSCCCTANKAWSTLDTHLRCSHKGPAPHRWQDRLHHRCVRCSTETTSEPSLTTSSCASRGECREGEGLWHVITQLAR